MAARIEPEPSEDERAAILAALRSQSEAEGGWADAALAEGVDDGGLDP